VAEEKSRAAGSGRALRIEIRDDCAPWPQGPPGAGALGSPTASLAQSERSQLAVPAPQTKLAQKAAPVPRGLRWKTRRHFVCH